MIQSMPEKIGDLARELLRHAEAELLFLREKTRNWQALYTESQKKVKSLEEQLEKSNNLVTQMRNRIINLEQNRKSHNQDEMSFFDEKVSQSVEEEKAEALAHGQPDFAENKHQTHTQ